MRRLALACLALVACTDPAPPCAPPVELSDLRLRADGQILRDAAGRAVRLRGVNTGGRSKDPPFMPFEFAEAGQDAPPFADALATYADRLVGWGVNVARVPFSWEAVEPVRGRYDTSYLDRYVALVEALSTRGIRVIVELHQDVFHRTYCGAGFPDWALPSGDPPPSPDCRFWFSGYLSNAGVREAFDRFWANADDLQIAFEGMWRHVAAQVWQIPGVIGFEIINEPASGTAEPERWAVEVLAPFVARMAEAIRAVAPDALIFAGGSGQDGLEGDTALPRPDAPGIVFAPHLFAPSVILRGTWDGTGDVRRALTRLQAIGGAWDAPVLLGAFGVPPEEGAVAYLRSHYEALDALGMHATLSEYSTSHLTWNETAFSITTPDGREYATVDAFVRPYPAAVAGEVSLFRFDPDARTVELRYQAEAGGITEVRVPPRIWPDGPLVDLDQSQGCVEIEGDRVRVKARFDEQIIMRIR